MLKYVRTEGLYVGFGEMIFKIGRGKQPKVAI
jgi:hypothetical protein